VQRTRLVLLGCLWAVSGALPAPAANPAGYPPADVIEIVARLNGQRLSVDCRGSITPAAAVISAGMTAEGLKPADVQQQLERQLAAVEELAHRHGGIVRRLERLRAVRGPGEPAQPAPFVVLQRLEIELPLSAPIDAVLDGLLPLGVDRFGNEMRLEDAGRGAKLVALYRFDHLDERLRDIQAECRKQGFRQWCEQHSSQDGCADILDALAGYFHDDGLRLDGLRMIDSYGSVSLQSLNWPSPGMRLEDIRVGSPEPVELSGTFFMQFDLRPR
jgi:hypothetical protein